MIGHDNVAKFLSKLSPNEYFLMGPHVSEWGRCTNKTAGKKAPKRCTFSPDDPQTSTELNCSVEMRMAKGAFSLRSLFGEFLLLGK